MSDAYEWNEPLPSRERKPIPRSAYGHFVAAMMIHDSEEDPGQISRCGSMAEYRTRMIVLVEPDTVDVLEQVGPLYWKDSKNEPHEHYVDHVVLKSDGRLVGLSDKPYALVTDEFGDELYQVANDGYAKGVLDKLCLVTEYARDPVVLFNAELMRGCRDADAEADVDARTVVEQIDGVTALRTLVDLIGMGPRGFRALVRLIQAGDLVQTAHVKISHASIVRKKDRDHD